MKKIYLYISFIFFILLVTALFGAFHVKAQSTCTQLPTNTGSISVSATLPKTGDYYIFTRMKAPSSTNNSMFIVVDGYCPGNIGTATIGSWTWVPFGVNIAQTNTLIKLVNKLDGIAVDRVMIIPAVQNGQAACTPVDTGDNCVGSATVSSTPGSCPKKNIGNADCVTNSAGAAVDILDYAILYSELTKGCSSSNPAGCGTDADHDGNVMDANFNYPGTNYITTDTIVNSFDYAVWIQGYLVENGPRTTPTNIPGATNTPTPQTTITTAPTATPTTPITNGPTPTLPPVTPGKGIWISTDEIMRLPTSGAAWDRLLSDANGSWGSANLSDNNSMHDVYTLAGALVSVRTNNAAMKQKTINGLQSAMVSPLARTLELSRGLQTYIIAADIIGYHTPAFESWVRKMLTANVQPHDAGDLGTCPSSITGGVMRTASCSANNWGGHARASLAAAAMYLNDASLKTQVRDAYLEFIGVNPWKNMRYTTTTWHTSLNPPNAVNPQGATRSGVNLSGVLPEDWRRGTVNFQWTPMVTGYMWEGMQGYVVTAVILHRANLVPFNSGNNAVVRSMNMLYGMGEAANNKPVFKNPASGDDTWIPWVVNYYAGTSFPTDPAVPGKNMGYTDWTLAK